MRSPAFGLVLALGLTAATPALADDGACIQAYESTQMLRKAGKLREARADAAKCALDSCPSVLSKDCQKWQTEIDAQLPSVVFEVRGSAGEPISNVKITVNGQPLVDRIDGSPITLEAGEQKFHFESPEGRGLPVDETVTLKDGEKAKKVSVRLGSKAPPPAKPLPLGPIIFGATGVVAAGVGTVFAIMGSSSESDLDGCKPRCSADDVNSVSTKYAVADILFAAGAVSLVAAAYMWITRPTAASPAVGRQGYGPTLAKKPGFVLEF